MLGIIPFISGAGRKVGELFKGKEAEDHIRKEADKFGLKHKGVDIKVADDGKVRVAGKGLTQEQKEKLILMIGNAKGIAAVEDGIEADDDHPPSKFHTVESGDTLWKIAAKHYGKGNRYTEIFEANRPMLSDPDKIYPGQVLRIPADMKGGMA